MQRVTFLWAEGSSTSFMVLRKLSLLPLHWEGQSTWQTWIQAYFMKRLSPHFSNFNVHKNYLETMLKSRLWHSSPWSFLNPCISNKLPGDNRALLYRAHSHKQIWKTVRAPQSPLRKSGKSSRCQCPQRFNKAQIQVLYLSEHMRRALLRIFGYSRWKWWWVLV